MNYLREIAEAHYYAGSRQSQKLAHEFFDAMDEDESGEVDYSEFMEFLREEGYEDYAEKDLFKRLDRNGDKGLDFWEVMTLYYIIKSGRPFCFGCDKFLTAVYFACVECFEKSSGPFYVCTSCYRDHNYDHSHRNARNPRFLDNYSLLEAHRLSSINEPSEHQVARSSSNPNAIVTYSRSSSSSSSASSPSASPSRSSSSRAMVQVPSRSGSQRGGSSMLRKAYKAFEMGVTVVSVGSSVGCCIM